MTTSRRRQKIEMLKKAIEKGRYTPDASAIADAIVRRARARLANASAAR